jgi:DNA end-binding protein Ku
MAKKTSIILGLLSVPVTLEPAVDDESGQFKTIHTHDGTDPAKVTVKAICTVCEETRSSVFAFPERGREVDGKLVVVTSEEMAEASGKPVTSMVPAFHSREKVYAATVAGDSVQNVSPQKGFEVQYVALRNALMARPDVVGVTVWSPKSKNSLWVLEVVNDRIVASKRSWPADVRAVAAAPLMEVSPTDQQMVEGIVDNLTTDFDVHTYVDEAKAGVERLVSERLGNAVVIPAGATVAPTASVDLTAVLQASLNATAKKVPAQRTRKAPAKKAAAKKTAAKRTTTRTRKAA